MWINQRPLCDVTTLTNSDTSIGWFQGGKNKKKGLFKVVPKPFNVTVSAVKHDMSWAAVVSLWSPCTCQPSGTGGKPGVKRGTLWKVRHDGTALNSQPLFSLVCSQGTACATVAPVSAGTAGLGTLVRSGWGRSTERWRRMGEKAEAQAARSNGDRKCWC